MTKNKDVMAKDSSSYHYVLPVMGKLIVTENYGQINLQKYTGNIKKQ